MGEGEGRQTGSVKITEIPSTPNMGGCGGVVASATCGEKFEHVSVPADVVYRRGAGLLQRGVRVFSLSNNVFHSSCLSRRKCGGEGHRDEALFPCRQRDNSSEQASGPPASDGGWFQGRFVLLTGQLVRASSILLTVYCLTHCE